MEKIEKEEELKALLKANGFNYGIGATDNYFVIEYLDNKSGMTIRNPTYYDSPISAIRGFDEYLKQLHFPVSDCIIHLIGVAKKSLPHSICLLDLELSPYLYYQHPEEVKVNNGDSAENKK